MNATTVQVLAVLFLATFIRSTLGFGEALVAVPLLALTLPVQVAAPLAVLVSITVAVVVVIQDWRNIHLRSAGWLVLSTLFGIPLGLLILKTVSEPIVKLILGLFIIAFALYSLAGRKPELHNDRLAPFFGFTAGILGGAYGMNGPPLVVYGVLRRWSPAQFRATLQGYFLVASMVGMVGYAVTGLWTRVVTTYFLLSLPLALTAIFFGRVVHRRLSNARFLMGVHIGLALIGVLLLQQALFAQEASVEKRLHQLRSLPDSERVATTRKLALEIRRLPTSAKKEPLANLVTEGDPGHDTLQDVATTLALALHEQPAQAASPYVTLAQLVRYEHVRVSLDDPKFAAAMQKLEADDHNRQHADFTLTDLHGMQWNLRALQGKVVLVNFWATWCPPCRKELPDLEALYQRFGSRGLVILAISDEDAGKVAPFVAEHKLTYPVLLDPGRKVNELLQIEGIPKSFVYDRSGKLSAEAIDMRTRRQFLDMLQRAGLE